jgi:hypothetical protein
MRKLMACLVALVATAAANAAPILFTFESTSQGTYSTLPITQGGLTATISTNTPNFLVTGPFGGAPGWGNNHLLVSFNTFPAGNYFQVNFSQPLTSASVQFADFFADSDTPVTLDAYSGLNGTGSIVASDSEVWPATSGFPAFGTLSLVSATPFQSIRFTGGGGFPNSLFWDNLQVEVAPVPEPISLVVFGGLVAVGGLVARKRLAKKAVA